MPQGDIISSQNPMVSKLIMVHDALITKLIIDTQSFLNSKYQISANSKEQRPRTLLICLLSFSHPLLRRQSSHGWTCLLLLQINADTCSPNFILPKAEEICETFTSGRDSTAKTFINFALYVFYNPVFSWYTGSETTRILLTQA